MHSWRCKAPKILGQGTKIQEGKVEFTVYFLFLKDMVEVWLLSKYDDGLLKSKDIIENRYIPFYSVLEFSDHSSFCMNLINATGLKIMVFFSDSHDFEAQTHN